MRIAAVTILLLSLWQSVAGTQNRPEVKPDTAQSHAQTPPPPVIDVHMHAPPRAGLKDWLAMMESLNVRHAVLIGVPAQLDELTKAAPGRFIPSLMFPCEGGKTPSFGIQCFADGGEFPSVALVREKVKGGGLKALGELSAQYMGVAPNDPRLEPYFSLAEELDLPVGLHLGIGPPGVSYASSRFPPRKSPNYRGAAGDPFLLEEVLIRHPKMRLYVMHAAWPMRDAMLYLLYMHPQVYVDISVLQWAIPRAAYYSYLRDLVEAGFGQRIMFGSDGGPRHLKEGVQAIMEADFLTAEQKRDILYNNAARFFRLDEGSVRP